MFSHENKNQCNQAVTVLVPVEPSALSQELFEAVKCDKTHEVKQLLISKADPNSRGEKGFTPIMVAVLQKNTEILKSLIAHKADVTTTDNDGQTALHKAAEKGHYELFDTLLEAKADINSRTKEGETPLYTAADNGWVDTTKYLLTAKANPNVSRRNGWSPLLNSSYDGYKNITQLLIEAKANVHQSYHSMSPLYYAAYKGHLSIVKMLVAAGAKKSLLAQSDKGYTPLIVAAEAGKLSVVEYLLEESVDIDLTTLVGCSALFQAAMFKQAEIFKTLLKARADLHSCDSAGNTILHAAAVGGQPDIIRSLIDSKLDINALNKEGETPLVVATKRKNNVAILTLLKAGADPNIKSNDETALNYAVLNEQPEMVRVLLEYKANPDQLLSSGKTLLRYAQDKHNIAIEEALKNAGVSHIPKGQHFFVEPMQKTGLKGNMGGVCYGLVCKAMQDYFSRDLQKLLEQLESIARTSIDEFKPFAAILKKNRKEWLQRAITELSDVLTTETGHIITAETLWLNKLTVGEIKILLNIKEECDEQTLRERFSRFLIKKVYEKVREYREAEVHAHPELEIPYLFEEVDAYYSSLEYRDWFPKGSAVVMQNFLQTLPLFAPKTLNPEDILKLDCIKGMYTKRELEFYFTSLYEVFEKYPGRIAFKVDTSWHSTVFFPPQAKSSEWQSLDPERMMIHNVSKKELTKYVLASFKSTNVVGLQLEIFVNKKDITIAEKCLQQWKSHPTWKIIHTVTPHKAQMVDDSKRSLLSVAAMDNDLALMKTILEMKANPDYTEKKGFTELRLAAQNGRTEIIKLLHTYRASLEPVTDRGETPLQMAVQEGQLESVKYLLDAKVNINHQSNAGYSCLHSAAAYNQLDILPLLIEAKADLQCFSSNEETPLSLAAERGHVEMVKLLLSMRADVNTRGTLSGSALYKAAENGHAEIVQILIDAKADVSFNLFYKTPLLVAVQKGHAVIVKNLLKIEPDALNKLCGYSDETLLMYAVRNGHFEVAKLLLEAKADPNIVSSRSSSSALYYAVENNSLDIVKLLLELGTNPKQCDSPEKSSLEKAVEDGRIDIVTILLKHGAKPTDMCLFNAVKANDIELVESLKAHGCKCANPVSVSLSEISCYLKKHRPDAVAKFDEFLQSKLLEDTGKIKISALELANIMGNEKVIQALQSQPLVTNSYMLWSRVPSIDPIDVILEYSENTTIEVRDEIERILGKY